MFLPIFLMFPIRVMHHTTRNISNSFLLNRGSNLPASRILVLLKTTFAITVLCLLLSVQWTSLLRWLTKYRNWDTHCRPGPCCQLKPSAILYRFNSWLLMTFVRCFLVRILFMWPRVDATYFVIHPRFWPLAQRSRRIWWCGWGTRNNVLILVLHSNALQFNITYCFSSECGFLLTCCLSVFICFHVT